MSCSGCSKSHSTVNAFLLTCRGCTRKWHHRCHIPPVTDQELVSRIKAHTAGDKVYGLEGWKCEGCARSVLKASLTNSRAPSLTQTLEPHRRGLPASSTAAPASSSLPSRPVSRLNFPASAQSASTNNIKDVEVIVIDDSDSDTSPGPPFKSSKSIRRPASEVTSHVPATASSSGTSRGIKGVKSTSRTSKPVHPLAQEEEESSDSAQKGSLPIQRPSQSYPSQPTTLSQTDRPKTSTPLRNEDSPQVTPKPRGTTPHYGLSKEEKEGKREDFKRKAVEHEKQRRLELRRRQQEFRKAKSEEKEHVELITSHVVDMTLYTDNQTPGDLAVTTSNSPVLPQEASRMSSPDAPISTIIVSTVQAEEEGLPKEPESNLATQWTLARDDEDMWDRALRKKGSTPPFGTSRRKPKAQKLGDVRPPLYYFNSIQWEDGMKRGPR